MAIVDTLELGAERQEWRRVVETLRTKSASERSDLETSRLLTLISRFKIFSTLSFDTRLNICRALSFERVAQKGAELISAQELQSYQGAWRLVLSGSVEMRVSSGQGRARHEVLRGEAIGDQLTLKSLPAGSSYVTKEPCDFLCLRHDDYDRLLGHMEERELDARVQFLSEGLVVPIFASWGAYQLRELAQKAYPRRYASRSVVVREREEGQDLYFIRVGECRVVREVEFCEQASQGIPSRKAVKLLELALLMQGEYFGELALLGLNVDHNARHRAEAVSKRAKPGSSQFASSSKRSGTSSRKAISPSNRPAPSPMRNPLGRGAGRASLSMRQGTERMGGGGTTPKQGDERVQLPGALGADSDADSDNTDELPSPDADAHEAGRGHQTGGLRQATVFSHTPLELLVLPAQAARELITGNPLQRMIQYAKGYPTAPEIRSQFMAQHDWATFKQNLVSDIISVQRGGH
eukprot:Hpha_TRINITY_DN3989_c0_g1::TRINITY_DN3989_c0_g1_i1::g.18075::m.18075